MKSQMRSQTRSQRPVDALKGMIGSLTTGPGPADRQIGTPNPYLGPPGREMNAGGGFGMLQGGPTMQGGPAYPKPMMGARPMMPQAPEMQPGMMDPSMMGGPMATMIRKGLMKNRFGGPQGFGRLRPQGMMGAGGPGAGGMSGVN